MGPIWVLSAPDGPMLAPWTLLSGTPNGFILLSKKNVNTGTFVLEMAMFATAVVGFITFLWSTGVASRLCAVKKVQVRCDLIYYLDDIMMTLSHGNFYVLLVLRKGNPPVSDGFSSQWTSNADLWFSLLCWPAYGDSQMVDWPVTWDALTHVILMDRIFTKK